MWFSVVLVKFHWFGNNWHVFNQSEYRNCCLYSIIQKIAPQAKSGKYYQIWFFPRFGGEMAAFWACACKLSWTLLSPARVQPLYEAGRKESSGTGLRDGKTLTVVLCTKFCPACDKQVIASALVQLRINFTCIFKVFQIFPILWKLWKYSWN